MKSFKIEIDQTKSYASAKDALEDNGYAFDSTCFINKPYFSKSHRYQVFSKNGELFAYSGMDHFNTQIFSVSIFKVKSEWLTPAY